MRLIIPTRGRHNEQVAYDFLHEAGYQPELVGNSEEDIPFHARNWHVFPHDNVGQVRQHILENNHGKVMMVDDDIRFHFRKPDGYFRRATQSELEFLLKDVEDALDEYCLVGIASRFMGHTRGWGIECNARINGVLAYNTGLFPLYWPKFRLANSEDADFQLQLLTKGYSTGLICSWAIDDKGKYREGGCSHYRPRQDCVVEQESAEFMRRNWPGLVTIDKRGQLRVAWKRAFRNV